MVAYVNIIRSINALPLDHTKARTLWLKCESGEEIKIKINGCLPFFFISWNTNLLDSRTSSQLRAKTVVNNVMFRFLTEGFACCRNSNLCLWSYWSYGTIKKSISHQSCLSCSSSLINCPALLSLRKGLRMCRKMSCWTYFIYCFALDSSAVYNAMKKDETDPFFHFKQDTKTNDHLEMKATRFQ